MQGVNGADALAPQESRSDERSMAQTAHTRRRRQRSRVAGVTGAGARRQGKVGAAFTSVGGHGRGFGGHEAILQSFHATFLQHGMARPP
jgi:hypothetical protein